MNVKLVRRAAAAILLVSATAGLADTFPTPPAVPGYTPPQQPWAVFDFTTGNNNNVQDGNARYFSATSSKYGTFNVRVTGWSLETVNTTVCTKYWGSFCIKTETQTQTYVRDSKLMVYDNYGLGIISGDDDGGSNNQHTIDNEGRKDFLMFQFDRVIEPVAATFNTFSVLGSPKDSDITVKYGDSTINWNAFLNLDGKTGSELDAMFRGGYENKTGSGSDNTRYINTGRQWGNLWLIGASFYNPDSNTDGFKLESLAVVPEPQSWAMMIAGFGLIGGAMRAPRRRRAALQQA